MKSVLENLGAVNKKYSMFNALTSDMETGDAKFLFSSKDNLTSEDFETCCGSRILEGYHPAFDATPIANIRKAGGKLIG
ncbi:MAG: amidase family protein, partial [Candidatus Methanomethylophilaceae archaeon]|nr:amidase family protein [Candidatus Methanomethylophilaceae archaeon]